MPYKYLSSRTNNSCFAFLHRGKKMLLYSLFKQTAIYHVSGLEICLYQPKSKKQALPGHLTATCLVRSWDKNTILRYELKAFAFSYQYHKTGRNVLSFSLLVKFSWNWLMDLQVIDELAHGCCSFIYSFSLQTWIISKQIRKA